MNERHRVRWSLWAAKESAYKAACQIDPGVRFLPRDFVVRFSGERGEVTHRLGRFDVWLDQTDEWLHAVASRSGEKPGFRVAAIPAGGGSSIGQAPADSDSAGSGVAPALADEDSSHRVRRLARDALGNHLDLAPGEIRIVTVDGIPRARRIVAPPQGGQRPEEPRRGESVRAERLPVDLSLSHDGRFIACAWMHLGRTRSS